MTENTCGYEKDDGEPCKRPAGWGTDASIGHCRDHAEEFRTPRKLDEETKQSLIGAAQTGAFKRHCAEVAGITPQTLRNWLRQGEEHANNGLETPLAEFYFRFQRARGAGAVSKLREVNPEFVLERSYGYTKSHEVELTGEGGGPIEISINETIVETGYSQEQE